MSLKSWFDRQTVIGDIIQKLNTKTEETNRLLTDLGNITVSMANKLGANLQPITQRSRLDAIKGKIIGDSRFNDRYRIRSITCYSEFYSIAAGTLPFTVKLNMQLPEDCAILGTGIIPESKLVNPLTLEDLNYLASKSIFRNSVEKTLLTNPLTGISHLSSAYLVRNAIDLTRAPLIFSTKHQDRLVTCEDNLHTVDATGIWFIEFAMLDKLN
jgi:hypothetical protein